MQVAIGFFWGAFFGTVALMFAGALAAFVQSHHRVALAAGLTALLSALFVGTYLAGLPIADPALEARLIAHIGLLSAIMLKLMLLVDLGLLRERDARRRILASLGAVAAITMAASWLVPPREALALGVAVSFALAVLVLLVTVRSALDGDRLAWLAVLALAVLLLPVAGVGWIALEPQGAPWQVHAIGAAGGMIYLAAIGAMLWQRYSYLIELREVLVQGPRYDPITRMQSQAGTAHMVGRAFLRQQSDPARPVVLLAVSIGNLYALESLHGSAALNHALFVCASRLRRCVPPDMDIGRLFEDGFLLVSRNLRDLDRVVQLGRLIAKRLSRPVTLRTTVSPGDVDEGQAPWAAQIGVGLLATTAQAKPVAAVGKVRDMSRTAWSFASRVAWHDEASGLIAEVSETHSKR
jgi:GGDEF domain-containing protein